MNDVVYYCLFIVVANGMMLTLYHYWLDPHKDVERHYYRNSKITYCVFKVAYLVLLFSFMFSLRYVVMEGLQRLRG